MYVPLSTVLKQYIKLGRNEILTILNVLNKEHEISHFSSVHSLGHVWLFATLWTTARQASLSIANSCKERWALKNWCFWTVELEKTLESLLDSKEMQPVHLKGDQSWVFIGRTDIEAETPILWPPNGKSWLIGKDPDAGKDWGQEKGTTEDEMVGWYHQHNGHGSGWTLGVGDGQGGLACSGS